MGGYGVPMGGYGVPMGFYGVLIGSCRGRGVCGVLWGGMRFVWGSMGTYGVL